MSHHIHGRHFQRSGEASQKYVYAWDNMGQARIVGERGGNFRGYSSWNFSHHGHHGGGMSTKQAVLAAVLTGVGVGIAGEMSSRSSGMTGAERTGATRLSSDFMTKIADGRYSRENLKEAMAVRENAFVAGDMHGYTLANHMVKQLGYALEYQNPHVTMREDLADQSTTASSERFGRYGLIGQLFGIR